MDRRTFFALAAVLLAALAWHCRQPANQVADEAKTESPGDQTPQSAEPDATDLTAESEPSPDDDDKQNGGAPEEDPQTETADAAPAGECSADADCPDGEGCATWCPYQVDPDTGECVSGGAGHRICEPSERRSLEPSEFMFVFDADRMYGVLRTSGEDPLRPDESVYPYPEGAMEPYEHVHRSEHVLVARADLDPSQIDEEHRDLVGTDFRLSGPEGETCEATATGFASVMRLQATANDSEVAEPSPDGRFYEAVGRHGAFHVAVELDTDADCSDAVWARATDEPQLFHHPATAVTGELADRTERAWQTTWLNGAIEEAFAEGWWENAPEDRREPGHDGSYEDHPLEVREFHGPDGDHFVWAAAWTGQVWCGPQRTRHWSVWRVDDAGELEPVDLGTEMLLPSIAVDLGEGRRPTILYRTPYHARLHGEAVWTASEVVTAATYTMC